MRIEITRSAADDIADGYLYYESQESGVGAYFEKSVMADIRSLQIYAGVHEIHFQHYHRMIASRFPFAIFYEVEGEVIRVFAVLDTRRDPEWISKRLN